MADFTDGLTDDLQEVAMEHSPTPREADAAARLMMALLDAMPRGEWNAFICRAVTKDGDEEDGANS